MPGGGRRRKAAAIVVVAAALAAAAGLTHSSLIKGFAMHSSHLSSTMQARHCCYLCHDTKGKKGGENAESMEYLRGL